MGQGAFLKIHVFWLVKSLKRGDSQFLGLVTAVIRRRIVYEEHLMAFLLGSHLLTPVDEEEMPSTMYRYSPSFAVGVLVRGASWDSLLCELPAPPDLCS